MEQIFGLAAVGLALDGIGVSILGYAFFSKSLRNLKDESDPHWNSNKATITHNESSQGHESLSYGATTGTDVRKLG